MDPIGFKHPCWLFIVGPYFSRKGSSPRIPSTTEKDDHPENGKETLSIFRLTVGMNPLSEQQQLYKVFYMFPLQKKCTLPKFFT